MDLSHCQSGRRRRHDHVSVVMKPYHATAAAATAAAAAAAAAASNGDTDMACDYVSNQRCIDGLGFPVSEPWRPWSYTDPHGPVTP